MLQILSNIYRTGKIEAPDTTLITVHSHTPKEQGIFLQKIFDEVRPKQTLELGLAYGVSALFILEKHKEHGNKERSHLIIEPYPWKGVAEHNIKKAALEDYADIRYEKSIDVLPKLYYQALRIQYAYIDTTKLFDVVFTDFYFIDKILDVGGVIIFDDGGWPGVHRVIKFVNTLPHYKVYDRFSKWPTSFKRNIAALALKTVISLLPFKKHFYSGDMKTAIELGLNYDCIAFQKISEDNRDWQWDKLI